MSSDPSLDALQHLPRKVHLRKGTIVGRIVVWTLLIAVLVIGPICGVRTISRLQRLEDSGLVMHADLIDASVEHGKSDSYYFTVVFTRGSTSIEQKRLVTQQLYDEYSNQHTVPVTVSPTDPHDFEVGPITDEVIASTQKFWIWSIVALGAFAAALTAGVETSLRNEMRLMTKGHAVLGTVTKAVVLNSKTTTTNFEYTFETPLKFRDGKCSAQGDFARVYPTGSQFIVFYRPDDEEKSKPLPFFQMIQLES